MIYADFNGSAPLCEDVKDYLINRLQNGPYSNPNAIHHLGQKCLTGMEKSRSLCAEALGTSSQNLIFNSGSTEGISQVFYSVLDEAKKQDKSVIVISGIEHSAISNIAEHYSTKDFKLEIVPVLPNGIIDLNALTKTLDENENNLALVSIMAANNETGVIQPFNEISKLCTKKEVPYFCDTTQIIGKIPFNFDEAGMDYAVVSGHKIGAMTGTGILIAKDHTTLKPLIIGGGQERNLRGGTQHYLGFETLAVAFAYIGRNLHKSDALREKRIEFEKKLKNQFPEVVIIGEDAPRLASTTYASYPGIHGQAVQIELEAEEIYVSTSSACNDNEPATSKVLQAMGVTDDVGRGVIRISLGLCSPLEWYDKIHHVLESAYTKLGKLNSFN